MTKLTRKMQDDYEEFLVEIDMLLEDLGELLKKSRGYKDLQVRFDDESLERTEKFYLDVLSGKEKVDVSLERMNRIFIAYIGEAVINRAESGRARWALNTFEADPSFGTPVVIDWSEDDGIAISPVERRELLIENREPFLRDMIEYVANKTKFEEDFFKEFHE
jgi:hypothetical protein